MVGSKIRVALASQICASAMFLLCILASQNNDVGVSANGMIFISSDSEVEICDTLRRMRGDLSLCFSPRVEK